MLTCCLDRSSVNLHLLGLMEVLWGLLDLACTDAECQNVANRRERERERASKRESETSENLRRQLLKYLGVTLLPQCQFGACFWFFVKSIESGGFSHPIPFEPASLLFKSPQRDTPLTRERRNFAKASTNL